MEAMQIAVLSVRPRGTRFEAVAHAKADAARIWITVQFDAPNNLLDAVLAELARDEVLRYLDPS